MNQRTIALAAIPAVGLGLVLLARRGQVGPLIGGTIETVEESIPESWRAKFDEQFRTTATRIDDARDSLEETARLAGVRASGVVGSAFRTARNTAITSAIATLWISLAGAVLVFVFAPERHQQERLWNTVKPALDATGSALAGLWNLSGQLMGSFSRRESASESHVPEARQYGGMQQDRAV